LQLKGGHVIFGIGTDIVETGKMSQLAARGQHSLQMIFTDQEIEYCESKARAAEHYAARYAAKEATLKALKAGDRSGLVLSDIEVRDDEAGEPHLFVHGRVRDLFDQQAIRQTSISLSHAGDSAIAVIILEL
jgi:holo-[acyl-carrier protein] synthase